MAFRSFRAGMATRTILIVLNALAFAFLFLQARYPMTTALAGTLLLAQGWLLVASVERANGALTLFFRALRNADYTQDFAFPRGSRFDGLKAEYESVMDILRSHNLEKERHYQYIRAVVGSIGVGVLVFDQGEAVDLCNEAFKATLGIGEPRSLRDLERVDPRLPRLFRELKNGEKESFRLGSERDRLQLIVSASDFVLLGGKYRLVTLQDIRRELEENEIDAWQKMARVLTHEIMNSITPISSLASTASSILDQAVRRRRLGAARLSISRTPAATPRPPSIPSRRGAGASYTSWKATANSSGCQNPSCARSPAGRSSRGSRH